LPKGGRTNSNSHARFAVQSGSQQREVLIEEVIIGVDPDKVVDHHEELLASGRFATGRIGYAAMRQYVVA
jgi:hypothetical protein